jgi:hypothetical protein
MVNPKPEPFRLKRLDIPRGSHESQPPCGRSPPLRCSAGMDRRSRGAPAQGFHQHPGRWHPAEPPKGFARLADATRCFELLDGIARDCFHNNGHFVYVADRRQLEGATSKARAHSIAHLQAQPHITALIIFGAPTFLKFSLNLALKFYRAPYPVRLAEDEGHALRIARAVRAEAATAPPRTSPKAVAAPSANRAEPRLAGDQTGF